VDLNCHVSWVHCHDSNSIFFRNLSVLSNSSLFFFLNFLEIDVISHT
jgi:hypothetical protein